MTTPPEPAPLSPSTREQLARVSTATLTTLLFARGLRNVFIQEARLLNPAAPRLVGEAFTLRYIPAREDLDHLGLFEDPEHPQRKAVETIPPGQVLVVDSRKDRRAASAGGILATRLMKRGAAGLVTDGGLRDIAEIAALDFPVYCAGPSAPTNLTHHHAADLNRPIACGDVAVYPGDVLVGDADGVVVLPRHLAAELAEEAVAKTDFEDFVMHEVQGGASIYGLYPPGEEARGRYAAWRAARRPR
jgi:regulator of RNase E activity RraA